MNIENLTYTEYVKLRDSDTKNIDGEVWVPVIDLPIYEVSNLGRFRAAEDIIYSRGSRWAKAGDLKYKAGTILKQIPHPMGYLYVILYDPTRRHKDNPYGCIQSHIIVSWSFEGKKDNLTTDHINHIKDDNRICNLQRLSNQANNQKTYDNDEGGRWTKRKSAVIRSDGVYYEHLKYAVEDIGCSDSAILAAIRRNGLCGGYYWKYADVEKQSKIDSRRKDKRYSTQKRRTNKSYIVRHIESNLTLTCADMARKFKCVPDTIYYAIDYHNGYSKYLGAHFELVES